MEKEGGEKKEAAAPPIDLLESPDNPKSKILGKLGTEAAAARTNASGTGEMTVINKHHRSSTLKP